MRVISLAVLALLSHASANDDKASSLRDQINASELTASNKKIFASIKDKLNDSSLLNVDVKETAVSKQDDVAEAPVATHSGTG
jgi:DNA-directed RNA polymerase specialized sigma54-like protein